MRDWEVWDRDRAEEYLKVYGLPAGPTRAMAKRMRVGANLIEGKSVLDVGCGCGHMYPWIMHRIDDYLGVDVSDEMLGRARAFCGAEFKQGDVYDLSPFGTYDTVIAISLLIHLPDPEKAIQEMWKHAGRCLVAAFQLNKTPMIKTVKYKGGYIIVRWETWPHMQGILRRLEGVEKIRLVKVPGTPRNHYVKVTRVQDHEDPVSGH